MQKEFDLNWSKTLAKLIGPIIMVVTLSETVNGGIWIGVPPYFIYQNGTLLFVAGFSIIRSHNVWVFRWPVLVTAVGWFILVLGVFRMLFPVSQQEVSQGNALVWAIPAMLFCGVGAVLTYKGYSRSQ